MKKIKDIWDSMKKRNASSGISSAITLLMAVMLVAAVCIGIATADVSVANSSEYEGAQASTSDLSIAPLLLELKDEEASDADLQDVTTPENEAPEVNSEDADPAEDEETSEANSQDVITSEDKKTEVSADSDFARMKQVKKFYRIYAPKTEELMAQMQKTRFFTAEASEANLEDVTLPEDEAPEITAEDADSAEDEASETNLEDVTVPEEETPETDVEDADPAEDEASDTNSQDVTPNEEVSNELMDLPEGEPLVVTMFTTAYCPGSCCNGSNANRTASGEPMQFWHTVATGSAYPFGTVFYIPYFADQPNGGWFVVEDRLGDTTNPYAVDILMETHEICLEFGTRNLEVYVYAQ